MTDPENAEEAQNAYEHADAVCRGPRWPKSARPTEQEIESALVDAVLAEMVPPDELQRRHERGNHAACPPYWCDHRNPPASQGGDDA